ncbi:MAG: transposase [Desulfatitalea sp.]|nr:transposase [Desulfatitalea sp.]NNJ99617.1 transposase [Desulfatitalea sp.]
MLADSGYDTKDIERTVSRKKWRYIIALKKKRAVKTIRVFETTTKSKGWIQVATFFKNYRCLKWSTVRVPVNSTRKKRMEFRVRQITGYLRDVGKTQLICSEFKKRPQGRKKYLACNDLKATSRQILIGYRLRWAIEIFHKHIKMFLGFEDIATKQFAAVESHVHWIYCAYILMNSLPVPGVEKNDSIAQKQAAITRIVDLREQSRVRQLLTRFNGVDVYKKQLDEALSMT